MIGGRVVNAVGWGANVRGVDRSAGGRVLGSRRRRGASEAAIDEARTRLAHAAANAGRNPQPTLIVDSTAVPSSALTSSPTLKNPSAFPNIYQIETSFE